MHEGSTNPRLTQELRSVTDLALRATEVTAQSLGKAMSTLVVQEHHLWLSLAERSDVDKVRFLDALVSQAGLFGDTIKDCAQQFSAVQKQTEAVQHIWQRATRRCRKLLDLRRWRGQRRSFPRTRAGGESFHSVPLAQWPEVTTLSKKEQFPFSPSSQARGMTVCDALPPHSRPRCPLLPAAKRLRLGDVMPRHASLASPPGDLGSSAGMCQNATPSVPSSPAPLRCSTVGMSIVPLVPLARSWGLGLRCPTRPAGSFAQYDSAMRFSSPGDLPSSAALSRLRWQSEMHLSCTRRLLSSWQRMQSSRSL